MGKRDRTLRRMAERETKKDVERRIKLALLEDGGAPSHPIEVESASVIEPRATSFACAACETSGLVVEEHAARTFGQAQQRLREVRLRCVRCGLRREVYFRITTALLN